MTRTVDTCNSGTKECKSCIINKKHAEKNSGYVHHPEYNETDLDLCLHNTGAAFFLWATICRSCTLPRSPFHLYKTLKNGFVHDLFIFFK